MDQNLVGLAGVLLTAVIGMLGIRQKKDESDRVGLADLNRQLQAELKRRAEIVSERESAYNALYDEYIAAERLAHTLEVEIRLLRAQIAPEGG